MASFNRTILMGNTTRQPQSKTVGSSSVCEFGIAVNKKYRTASGEERENVLFMDCSAWGKVGEIIQQYVTQGAAILVEGEIEYHTWEKDGQKRSKHSLKVMNFQFVGGRPQGDGDERPAPAQRPAQARPAPTSIGQGVRQKIADKPRAERPYGEDEQHFTDDSIPFDVAHR